MTLKIWNKINERINNFLLGFSHQVKLLLSIWIKLNQVEIPLKCLLWMKHYFSPKTFDCLGNSYSYFSYFIQLILLDKIWVKVWIYLVISYSRAFNVLIDQKIEFPGYWRYFVTPFFSSEMSKYCAFRTHQQAISSSNQSSNNRMVNLSSVSMGQRYSWLYRSSFRIFSWWNIFIMSPTTAILRSRNPQRTFGRDCTRSGSFNSMLFKKTPLTVAATSHTIRSFFGFRAIPTGINHNLLGSTASFSSFVTSWMYPFCW